METISNEDKAKEIAETQFSWYSDFDDVNSFEECYESAMAMAQWKDKQHAKEKQQWIENAWNWLTSQKGERTIDDFINAMKGK